MMDVQEITVRSADVWKSCLQVPKVADGKKVS